MARNPFQTPAMDRSKTRTVLSGVSRWQDALDALLCGMPLVSYAYVCLFWLGASVSLGQWARPGIHDPSQFFLGIPHLIHMGLMLAVFAVAPVVVVQGFRRHRLLRYVAAYFVCLAGTIILYRADLFSITMWIAD